MQCVIVDWFDGMNLGLRAELDSNAVYMDNIKMAAQGYPKVIVDIVSCRWYIPVTNPMSTWLILKHNFPVREVTITLAITLD